MTEPIHPKARELCDNLQLASFAQWMPIISRAITSALAEPSRELAQKDERIERLTGSLRAREALCKEVEKVRDNLAEELAQKDEEISRLNVELAQKREEAAELNKAFSAQTVMWENAIKERDSALLGT